jgi:formamidopyrimidine-DNA glycosylase
MTKIYKSLGMVITTAVGVQGDSSRFPNTWLFHKRWSRGVKKTLKMGKHGVEFVTVGGRSSAFVPKLQQFHASECTRVRKRKTEKKGEE